MNVINALINETPKFSLGLSHVSIQQKFGSLQSGGGFLLESDHIGTPILIFQTLELREISVVDKSLNL